MERVFTAVFENVGKFYIGWVEELPGVNTQAGTLEEVRENIREAIELVLLSNRELTEKKLEGKKFIEKAEIDSTKKFQPSRDILKL